MRVDVKIEGIDRVVRKLGPERTLRPIRRFLADAARTAEAGVDRNAPASAIKPGLAASTRGDAGLVTGPRLATFLDAGTKPHMPPVKALKAWADSRGIDPFLAARAVAKKGTRRRRFVARALRGATADIRALVDRLGADIRRAWEAR